MGGYLKSTLRFFALVVVAWFVMGLIGGIWPFLGAPFAAPLIFLGVPALLLTLLIGTAVWLKRGIRLASEVTRWDRILLVAWVPALCVVTFFAMGPLISLGSYSGAHVRLAGNYQRYEAIIAKNRNRRESPHFAHDGGVDYFVFSGSPLRIQFAGLGEVHSLFGNIEFDDQDPAPPEEASAVDQVRPRAAGSPFFADANGCRPLRGHYLLCRFPL